MANTGKCLRLGERVKMCALLYFHRVTDHLVKSLNTIWNLEVLEVSLRAKIKPLTALVKLNFYHP